TGVGSACRVLRSWPSRRWLSPPASTPGNFSTSRLHQRRHEAHTRQPSVSTERRSKELCGEMKKLLLAGVAALFVATGPANAFIPTGCSVNGTYNLPCTPYVRSLQPGGSVGQARPINVSPTTGRPYDTGAPDYRVQRRSKRK